MQPLDFFVLGGKKRQGDKGSLGTHMGALSSVDALRIE